MTVISLHTFINMQERSRVSVYRVSSAECVFARSVNEEVFLCNGTLRDDLFSLSRNDMKQFGGVLGSILLSVLSFLVMIVLAILSFYITVFVVSAGAGFAGYDPSADFVVLSSALLVVGAILSGGLSPVLFLTSAFDPKGDSPAKARGSASAESE